MTLDEVLGSLFPRGHSVGRSGEVVTGHGPLKGGGAIAVIGIVDGAPLSPEAVMPLADHVLGTIEAGGSQPILVLVDTQGQLMARHAEMVGLNEYCAHLAKCLLLASRGGQLTIGFEYGKAAAGAFLATALATDVLIGIEGAADRRSRGGARSPPRTSRSPDWPPPARARSSPHRPPGSGSCCRRLPGLRP